LVVKKEKGENTRKKQSKKCYNPDVGGGGKYVKS